MDAALPWPQPEEQPSAAYYSEYPSQVTLSWYQITPPSKSSWDPSLMERDMFMKDYGTGGNGSWYDSNDGGRSGNIQESMNTGTISRYKSHHDIRTNSMEQLTASSQTSTGPATLKSHYKRSLHIPSYCVVLSSPLQPEPLLNTFPNFLPWPTTLSLSSEWSSRLLSTLLPSLSHASQQPQHQLWRPEGCHHSQFWHGHGNHMVNR